MSLASVILDGISTQFNNSKEKDQFLVEKKDLVMYMNIKPIVLYTFLKLRQK